ncbi:MAG TPA: dTDP-4-amino-4,6-dideoxygalactose transaminase [Clostridia bacterium]|nr:dTDP-4-amino-4,6-dideoxygalactose transaminase [Clostridia bacterium]
MEVPFNREYYTGQEIYHIKDVMKSRRHTKGDGYYTEQVSALLEDKFNVRKVFMTTSGTHALELSTALIDLKPYSEVIMPSFTFPSTANAVLNSQAEPIFVEIEGETLNIDPQDIKAKITKNTKAIMPIHYAGIAANMDQIIKIARKHNLTIIEDAAQAVNSKYKGKYLGTIGKLGCFSFHSTKNYISGEGGALLINQDDPKLIERASILREKGTNRSSFLRGEVDKYSWVDRGSSYLPSDLLMAFLYAQLEKMDEIKNLREKIYMRYLDEFNVFLEYDFITSMSGLTKDREINFNSFYFIFNGKQYRDRAIRELKKRNITAAFHYIPLHISKMGKKIGYNKGDLPFTENIAENIMRLPLYTDMTEQELNYVVKNVKEIFREL